ncbi:MAG TPA: DUF167 domain-containing protein [Pyrinomonadaceae bacterium]
MVTLTEKDGNLMFTARVIPRASKSEIVGELDGALKIRIASPPVDGAANAELIKLLAKTFDVSKSDIEITSGRASKTKQIKIINQTREKLIAVLQAKNPRDIFDSSI